VIKFQKGLSALALIVAFQYSSLMAFSDPVWLAEIPSQSRAESEPTTAKSLADSVEKAISQGQSAKARGVSVTPRLLVVNFSMSEERKRRVSQ
jgi:hypothetical protein